MENLFSCKTCGVLCITENDLIAHQKIHDRKREEFECSSCPKVFFNRRSLKRHLKVHMTVSEDAPSQPHPCVICGQEFAGEVELKKHFSKIHTAQKHFKCRSCRKSFATSCELKKHKKLHVMKDELIQHDVQISPVVANDIECPKLEEVVSISAEPEKNSSDNHITVGGDTLQTFVKTERSLYKCVACGKSFTSSSTLKRHELMAHNKGKKKIYKCKVCSKQFSKLTDLKQHKEAAHSKPTTVNTDPGTSNTKEPMRVNNTKRLIAKVYRCQMCSKSFTQERTYKLHIMKHEEEEQYNDDFEAVADDDAADEDYQPYDEETDCEESALICDEIKVENEVAEVDMEYAATRKTSPKKKKKKKKKKSKEGSKKKKRKEDIQNSESISTKNEDVSNGADERAEAVKDGEHLDSDKEQLYIERFQNQQEGNEFWLGDNRVIIDDKLVKLSEPLPKPYECDICGRAFAYQPKLEQHKNVHDKSKVYKCSMCCRVFLQESHRKRHEGFHFRRFTCPPPCGKQFMTNAALKQHAKMHSTEKPYMCDICSKTFLRNYDLRRHQQIHSEKRAHVCEECSKGFKTANDLHQHMVVHSTLKPYVCETCSFAFARLNALRRHQMIHTGVKNFICEICNKAFLRDSQLKQHMRVHRPGAPPRAKYGSKVKVKAEPTQHQIINTETATTSMESVLQAQSAPVDEVYNVTQTTVFPEHIPFYY